MILFWAAVKTQKHNTRRGSRFNIYTNIFWKINENMVISDVAFIISDKNLSSIFKI